MDSGIDASGAIGLRGGALRRRLVLGAWFDSFHIGEALLNQSSKRDQIIRADYGQFAIDVQMSFNEGTLLGCVSLRFISGRRNWLRPMTTVPVPMAR